MAGNLCFDCVGEKIVSMVRTCEKNLRIELNFGDLTKTLEYEGFFVRYHRKRFRISNFHGDSYIEQRMMRTMYSVSLSIHTHTYIYIYGIRIHELI